MYPFHNLLVDLEEMQQYYKEQGHDIVPFHECSAEDVSTHLRNVLATSLEVFDDILLQMNSDSRARFRPAPSYHQDASYSIIDVRRKAANLAVPVPMTKGFEEAKELEYSATYQYNAHARWIYHDGVFVDTKRALEHIPQKVFLPRRGFSESKYSSNDSTSGSVSSSLSSAKLYPSSASSSIDRLSDICGCDHGDLRGKASETVAGVELYGASKSLELNFAISTLDTSQTNGVPPTKTTRMYTKKRNLDSIDSDESSVSETKSKIR